MPISSVITANIGTPSTNAANIRCTCAAIHTAPRGPMPGKCPYAPAVSAAAWTIARALVIANEEGGAFGEIDRHGAANFPHQLESHFRRPLAPGVLFESIHDHTAYERRDLRQPRLGVFRPPELPLDGR